eukprot:GHVN01055804.1.p1 GENE.GHVN01055804.1~~GHVN01055804.1.p1  ORF type:complete len:360 (+),score=3.79 GHVN01055804.1:486-1565(+)
MAGGGRFTTDGGVKPLSMPFHDANEATPLNHDNSSLSCGFSPCSNWLVQVGVVALLQMTFALSHTWGNLLPWVASAWRIEGGKQWSYEDGVWVYFALIISEGTAGMLLPWRFVKTVGPRWTIFGGGVLLAIGFIASSITYISPWQLSLTYGCLAGIGTGIAYPVTIHHAHQWAPNFNFQVNAFIAICRTIAIGGGILCQIHILNRPDTSHIQLPPSPRGGDSTDYLEDKFLLDRIGPMFQIVGTLCLCLNVFCSLLLAPCPTKESQRCLSYGTVASDPETGPHRDKLRPKQGHPYLENPHTNDPVVRHLWPTTDPVLSYPELLLHCDFWWILLLNFAAWMGVAYVEVSTAGGPLPTRPF